MSTPSERLAALGLTLPPVATPVAAYIPSQISGSHVFTSGQLPVVGGQLAVTGKLGAEVDTDAGYAQARIAALNALAALAKAADGLDNIERIVKATVFVASTPDFYDHPIVGNGASELFGEVFSSQHTRSAVGVAALPLNAPVEVEVIGQLA